MGWQRKNGKDGLWLRWRPKRGIYFDDSWVPLEDVGLDVRRRWAARMEVADNDPVGFRPPSAYAYGDMEWHEGDVFHTRRRNKDVEYLVMHIGTEGLVEETFTYYAEWRTRKSVDRGVLRRWDREQKERKEKNMRTGGNKTAKRGWIRKTSATRKGRAQERHQRANEGLITSPDGNCSRLDTRSECLGSGSWPSSVSLYTRIDVG
ncbi:hypothetical protein MPH_05204 [Macrophomina phaseolina MS6]|uniref:Uncharacterized protein n=1 Tax=Macrophomina phaseolina (strain MS6) TaxID=1126212 RepID=K2RSC0_MACPH|nr:hypothetical protein MPH_05204 [Macrophomina phaseolina MS6]